MEIKTATSFVGFLVALATLNGSAIAAVDVPQNESTVSPQSAESPTRFPALTSSSIDHRLARLTAALRERAAQLPESAASPEASSPEDLMIAGWANGRGGAWVNTGRGGWADGRGNRGFVNVNPWRNGWGDRGGFFNHNPWRNGGGGWLNRGW